MEHLRFEFIKKLLLRIKAAGFDSAEVIVVNEHMTEMQVDVSDISLLRNTESDTLKLKGILGGRYATVTLNQLDDTSIQAGIVRLHEAAQAAPVDQARQFAPAAAVSRTEVGPLEPMHYLMHDRVTQFLIAVGDNYPECMLKQSTLRYHRTRTLRGNTNGHESELIEGFYSHGVRFLSKRNGKTGSINYNGALAIDLEKNLLDWGGLRRSIESSVREIAYSPFHGELKGKVIISPEAMVFILNHWLTNLRDEKMIAGTSRFVKALDKPVASPLLSFGFQPNGEEFARHEVLTEDGYVSMPSMIVDKGLLRSFMLSDYGAKRTSLPRAANSGLNLMVEAGTTSLEELFTGVEQGLLLGRFSGVEPAQNGDFSGVAKNSFLIENGFIGRPVSEVIISGNIYEMMNAITGVSRERAGDGLTLVPWVCADGISVKGR